jgi:hypothetical protein
MSRRKRRIDVSLERGDGPSPVKLEPAASQPPSLRPGTPSPVLTGLVGYDCSSSSDSEPSFLAEVTAPRIPSTYSDASAKEEGVIPEIASETLPKQANEASMLTYAVQCAAELHALTESAQKRLKDVILADGKVQHSLMDVFAQVSAVNGAMACVIEDLVWLSQPDCTLCEADSDQMLQVCWYRCQRSYSEMEAWLRDESEVFDCVHMPASLQSTVGKTVQPIATRITLTDEADYIALWHDVAQSYYFVDVHTVGATFLWNCSKSVRRFR